MLRYAKIVEERQFGGGGHLAPPRADYEQVFAGANFNTEKISGAHVEVSGAHFKMLAIIKVSGAPLKASLKSPEHNLMK